MKNPSVGKNRAEEGEEGGQAVDEEAQVEVDARHPFDGGRALLVRRHAVAPQVRPEEQQRGEWAAGGHEDPENRAVPWHKERGEARDDGRADGDQNERGGDRYHSAIVVGGFRAADHRRPVWSSLSQRLPGSVRPGVR